MKILISICCIVFLCIFAPFLIPFGIIGIIIIGPFWLLSSMFSSHKAANAQRIDAELKGRMLAELRMKQGPLPYKHPIGAYIFLAVILSLLIFAAASNSGR